MNAETFSKRVLLGVMCIVCIGMLNLSAASAGVSENGSGARQVAEPIYSSGGISWIPKVNYEKLILIISAPDGSQFLQTFETGTAPNINLSNISNNRLSDGAYTYELRVVPVLEKRVRGKVGEASYKDNTLKNGMKTMTQTGYFQVNDGMIVTSNAVERLSRTTDIVHSDDVIIDGSLCVGNDCYSGLAFGFDTIVLMENNLRIFFDDTSSIQNYPRNDWRIVCNDSTDGGGNYFAIQDATDVSNIMVLEAGAPSNSIYVDSSGDVGINTSTPYYELHIVDGDSPAVRLEQDTSYGWPSQKWDVCGNESNFFIRDATHASKLPFRIEPDAATDSIFIDSSGDVGIGTGSPDYSLEVERTGTGAQIVANRTDGAKVELMASNVAALIGTMSNHPMRFRVNNVKIMELAGSGDYIEMIDGGTYDGTWNPASSREIKENIQDLEADEARKALQKLNPVKFNYKKNKKEDRVGFIAEDVPDLVAMKGRKTLGTVDIVAVLTKVVKEQQEFIREQQKINARLMKKISELEKK
jgi:hypothetical protein